MSQHCCLERVLEEIDAETVLVPGHGKPARRADLVAYVEILKAVRGRQPARVTREPAGPYLRS